MSLIDFEQERQSNPVDVIEQIAALNDWAFERAGDDEITISVRGGWSDYHVSFSWMEDREAIHLACAFDLKVPEARKLEVMRLLSAVNEQLWIGHFDLWSREGVVMYRQALLLSGGAEPNSAPGRAAAGDGDRGLRALLPGVPVRRLGRQGRRRGAGRRAVRDRRRSLNRRPVAISRRRASVIPSPTGRSTASTRSSVAILALRSRIALTLPPRFCSGSATSPPWSMLSKTINPSGRTSLRQAS